MKSSAISLDVLYAHRDDSPAATDAFYAAIRSYALCRLERDEDAAQDVLVSVFTSLEGFDERMPFKHWLDALITNHQNARIRELIEERETLVELTDQTVPAYAPSDDFLDISFITDPTTKRIAELILQGYSQTEVAAELGMTQQAISARLSRLRKK
jgi:RNA polymerase sigma factor (sigma-70 family)